MNHPATSCNRKWLWTLSLKINPEKKIVSKPLSLSWLLTSGQVIRKLLINISADEQRSTNPFKALKIQTHYYAPAESCYQKRQFLKITLQLRFLAGSENFLQLWGMRSRTGNVPSSLTLLLHNIYSKSHHKSARCRSLSHVLSFVTPTVVKEIFTTVEPT